MRHLRLPAVLAAIAVLTVLDGFASASPDAPLYFGGQGARHYEITTDSADAQRWFDQGLTLCYGFNHAEAIRSFEQAAKADPTCAMAYWGIAYAWGPHINNPEMNAEASEKAHAALATRAHLARPCHTARAAAHRGPAPPLCHACPRGPQAAE